MTRRTFKCRHCKRIRQRNPRIKDQNYCGAQPCQNARKNKWRLEKLVSDDIYRQGVRDSQEKWVENNQDYWQKYRDEHPAYTERNRKKQYPRNATSRSGIIAKRDALSSFSFDKSVKYEIRPVRSDAIAKRDALIVEIVALSPG